MQRIGVLVLAILICGCGKSKDPPPDMLKPWRPALENAHDVEKQMDRRMEDLKRLEDNAMKDDAK
jgi:hypothetical protein